MSRYTNCAPRQRAVDSTTRLNNIRNYGLINNKTFNANSKSVLPQRLTHT